MPRTISAKHDGKGDSDELRSELESVRLEETGIRVSKCKRSFTPDSVHSPQTRSRLCNSDFKITSLYFPYSPLIDGLSRSSSPILRAATDTLSEALSAAATHSAKPNTFLTSIDFAPQRKRRRYGCTMVLPFCKNHWNASSRPGPARAQAAPQAASRSLIVNSALRLPVTALTVFGPRSDG